MSGDAVLEVHRIAEDLFAAHGEGFGRDVDAYRNHVHRILGLIALQQEIPDDLLRPVAIAAFFHDSAIWLDDTWDYLQPSIDRALTELTSDEQDHRGLVTALIDEHHRIRTARHEHPLVEAFRRADMTDVYMGIPKSPGVPRKTYRALVREYPATGFRRVLVRAFFRGLRENPLRPLPMIKF